MTRLPQNVHWIGRRYPASSSSADAMPLSSSYLCLVPRVSCLCQTMSLVFVLGGTPRHTSVTITFEGSLLIRFFAGPNEGWEYKTILCYNNWLSASSWRGLRLGARNMRLLLLWFSSIGFAQSTWKITPIFLFHNNAKRNYESDPTVAERLFECQQTGLLVQ